MKLRYLITDTLGLACVLALTLAPLGFYSDDSGWGWFWPGLGGYHVSNDTH